MDNLQQHQFVKCSNNKYPQPLSSNNIRYKRNESLLFKISCIIIIFCLTCPSVKSIQIKSAIRTNIQSHLTKSVKDVNVDSMTAENTAHPEDQQDVSMKDMLVYSGIVEQEQSIKMIKDAAENSNKPKPFDDDSAMVLYDKNLQ